MQVIIVVCGVSGGKAIAPSSAKKNMSICGKICFSLE